LTLLLSLLVVGMWHSHAWVDHAQMRLSGVHCAGMQGGVVLAFILVAGFEGATSLGEEAQHPRSSIPRAILGCMLPVAVLYLVVTYCIASLENRGIIAGTINGLTVPFDNLAHAINSPWLGPLSSLGVALSYFACGLASLTIASRVLFAMARDGHCWPSFGKSHPVNGTPHRAIALVSIPCMGIPLGMMIVGADFGISFNFLTQLGSIGVVGAYLLVVVALPLYLQRQHTLDWRDLSIAGIAALLLGLVLVLSIYPQPAPPFGYVSYVFFASVAACFAVSLVRTRASMRARPGVAGGGIP
jgi:amino acid transporter